MAKKMISRLSVLAVLIVFLAACSKTVEYTNIIPADATVVTSINLKSLASKAGLNDKENEAAKQKVLEALKSGMNAATFQQLEKVMNNPSESGIDVEAPVYVFTSPSFPYSTAVAKIKSEDDLHASLEIMVKEQICQPINEAAGYSFTTMNGGLVAFNNSAVMLISVKGTSQIEKAKEGITTLYANEPYTEVLGTVKKMLDNSSHVYAHTYQDKELSFLEEDICPGIANLKEEMKKVLSPSEIMHIEHDNLIDRLDSISNLFEVVIIKTGLTKPYTSTFFELDCKYWDNRRQSILNGRIADAKNVPQH